MGYALDDGTQYVVYSLPCLARGIDDVVEVATDEVDNLVGHLFGHGVGHVDFVDDWHNLQVVVYGHVEVAYGLGLHALRGVNHQQCAFAGCYRTAHLVGEVYVARRINQVQYILLAAPHVLHLYGVTLDGDASFLLEVHVVEHLALGYLYGLCALEQTVGQGRLAVVDMGDDAEVAYVFH